MPQAIALHAGDNVATLIDDAPAGALVTVFGERHVDIALRESVAYGHKVALVPIARGADVLKYGQVIGAASTDIAAGAHVHTHNIESIRGRGDLAAQPT